MPKSSRSSAKRRWYTTAYLTREGNPHPAHQRYGNFSRLYKTVKVLLEDLPYAMNTEIAHRGAYVFVVWQGELSEWEALHGKTKPLYYVFEGGRVEKLKR